MTNPYHCTRCNTTDPARFAIYNRSTCKLCRNAKAKIRDQGRSHRRNPDVQLADGALPLPPPVTGDWRATQAIIDGLANEARALLSRAGTVGLDFDEVLWARKIKDTLPHLWNTLRRQKAAIVQAEFADRINKREDFEV